jgi:hypothetical protein
VGIGVLSTEETNAGFTPIPSAEMLCHLLKMRCTVFTPHYNSLKLKQAIISDEGPILRAGWIQRKLLETTKEVKEGKHCCTCQVRQKLMYFGKRPA